MFGFLAVEHYSLHILLQGW